MFTKLFSPEQLPFYATQFPPPPPPREERSEGKRDRTPSPCFAAASAATAEVAERVFSNPQTPTQSLRTPTHGMHRADELRIIHSNMASDKLGILFEKFKTSMLTPSHRGNNGALFLTDEGGPLAVIKSKQAACRTVGSDRPGREPEIKPGIKYEESPFTEFLANLVMADYLKLAEISEEEVLVPPSAWIQFRKNCGGVHFNSEAGFYEFIRDCTPLSEVHKNRALSTIYLENMSTEATQMVIVMGLLLLNTDGHPGNVLTKKSADGKTTLIPIDSLILPREGCASVEVPSRKSFAFFSDSTGTLSDKIREFILSKLDETILEGHLNKLKELEIEDALEFDIERRVVPHKIAIHLLKEGVRSGLNLPDICELFIDPSVGDGKAVAELYQIQKRTTKPLSELCATFIELYKNHLDTLRRERELKGERGLIGDEPHKAWKLTLGSSCWSEP